MILYVDASRTGKGHMIGVTDEWGSLLEHKLIPVISTVKAERQAVQMAARIATENGWHQSTILCDCLNAVRQPSVANLTHTVAWIPRARNRAHKPVARMRHADPERV